MPKPAAAKAPTVAHSPAAIAKPMTDDEKIIYALGLSIFGSLGQFDLSPAELDIVKKALTDAAVGKPQVDLQTWGPEDPALATSRGARTAEKQKALSAAFLTKAAGEPGAQKTQSGLIYRELRPERARRRKQATT